MLRKVSFKDDLVPILRQFRGSMLWRLDLTNYDHVKANAKLIRKKLSHGMMPPPPLPRFSKEQVSIFEEWMKTGFNP